MVTFKQYLAEDKKEKLDKQKCIFVWGRMNPPTIGHYRSIDWVRQYAKDHNCYWYVIPTKTVDKKDNLLSFSEKIKYLEKLDIPGINHALVKNPNLKTIIDVINELESKGFVNIILAVGADRFDEFKKQFASFNKDYYPKLKLEVVSTGKRTKGISGSDARKAAKENDFESFKAISEKYKIKNDIVAKELFNRLREIQTK